MRGRLAAFLFAGAALCLCTAPGAAPFGVLLCTDRIVLDTPAGFSDTAAFGSPRLTELAENLTEASSRVLVFALADSDVRKFGAGDGLELRRYLLAVTPRAKDRLEVRCRARTTGLTGVEMEAMVGASVAALTVYDMTKALSKGIVIERVELLAKSGGKSGDWRRGRA